jgi:hypothetical protein
MMVSRNYLLPIKFIAKLWAGELCGTPLEEPLDVLEKRLIKAFVDEELPPAAGSFSEELSKELNQIFLTKPMPTPREGYGPIDIELWIGPTLWSAIPDARIPRTGFLWWVENWDGYPPPTFWDGEELVPATVEQLTEGWPTWFEVGDLINSGLLKKHNAAPTGDGAPRAAKKRGRRPLVMNIAIDALRQAIKADPGLRSTLTDKTEKEMQHLCGGNVSRETARKALIAILQDTE